MPITVNELIIPATEEQVYNVLWIKELRIVANNPQEPIRVLATISRAKEIAPNTYTLPPSNLNAECELVIDDLFTTMGTDLQTVEIPLALTNNTETVNLTLADIFMAITLKIKQLAEDRQLLN